MGAAPEVRALLGAKGPGGQVTEILPPPCGEVGRHGRPGGGPTVLDFAQDGLNNAIDVFAQLDGCEPQNAITFLRENVIAESIAYSVFVCTMLAAVDFNS